MNSSAFLAFASAAPAPKPGFDPSFLIMMLLIFVMMYFVMIRPEQKRRKEHLKKLAALKNGDLVVTTGGLHGKIAQVKDHTVLIKVADQLKLEFDKNSVASVKDKTSVQSATSKADQAAKEVDAEVIEQK